MAYKVVKKNVLNPQIFLMEVEAPLVAKKAEPGQFIILRIDEYGERVPFTIADFDREKGTVTIIVQIVGKTTKDLAQVEEGEEILDFAGPLGTPTPLEGLKKVAVIGGGLGTAIAYPQAKKLHNLGADVTVITGFRNKDLVILEDELKKVSNKLIVATDDGSNGNQGFVTDMLKKEIEAGEKFDEVIAIGPLVMMKFVCKLTKEYGVKILPVDSEHSAIFQAIHGEENKEIHKLLITASGGPFRGRTTEELRRVTVADTLKHPNWVMGRKITVDSATLVNKGLEVMEAKWLFDMDMDHIQVVVQPQSIIHSMVEFKDGAIMAQLGTPDMRLPIQYALYYPHRRYLDGDRLDFTKLHEITFEVPDMETFRGLPMAIQASREGGSMPTVFNAANELAVKKFLEEKIGFLDIYEIIAQSMERHKKIAHPDLDEILSVEQDTYQWIESRW